MKTMSIEMEGYWHNRAVNDSESYMFCWLVDVNDSKYSEENDGLDSDDAS